ncbi:MAG: hypothetical protein N2484_09985 [Clostridia bacterium]|nr:hypothetical protein [Clostridia bacterium]
MKDSLGQHSSDTSFDSVWKEYLKGKKRTFKSKKLLTVPLVALITFIALCTVGFAGYSIMKNIDKTDDPFVNDSQVIGKWEAVDLVQKAEEFTPDKKAWQGELYLTAFAFIKDGKMLMAAEGRNLSTTTFCWTKDKILNKQEKTSSKYQIKEMNGSTYMFFEWKSGDYTFKNMTPWFYVLKKIDSNDYSNFKIARIEDKTDYPFVDEAQMKGKWCSVDFVKNIDEFKPNEKNWLGDLFLLEMKMEDGGKLTSTTTAESFSGEKISWTKGMILNKIDKTASKCEIKEIDGTKYMFFEWKSGDYTERGMKPFYYVLKKAE